MDLLKVGREWAFNLIKQCQIAFHNDVVIYVLLRVFIKLLLEFRAPSSTLPIVIFTIINVIEQLFSFVKQVYIFCELPVAKSFALIFLTDL
jgi:hypothetical protein